MLDDVGKHFLDHAVELVKSGMKFVYVVDNIDWEERVHDMSRSPKQECARMCNQHGVQQSAK